MGTRFPNSACMLTTLPLLTATIYLWNFYLNDLLNQFGELSGLIINKSKTEGLWLGVWKCKLGKDEPFGISWPKQYVTALGIAFPYNVRVGNKIDFEERLSKIKKSPKYLAK